MRIQEVNMTRKNLFNKIQERFYFQYKELLLSIAILLLIPIWIGFADTWYKWFKHPEHCAWIKSLYTLLDGSLLVNIPVCIVILFFTGLWWRKLWRDWYLRPYRLSLLILGVVSLNCGCDADYASIIGWLSYKDFLNILLGISIILVIIRIGRAVYYVIKTLRTDTDNNDKKTIGFTNDKIADVDVSESMRNYADVIAKRILATDTSKESFAVGISGEWGVGKTTFLELLKKNMVGKAEIVDFNPWMCSSPKQVIQDFFATIQKKLSPRYSTLSKSIREYARYVNYLMVTTHDSLRLNIVKPEEESLASKKNKLSAIFFRLPLPVVVIIDDVDRLERDEVFEVLRLIRNTADLQNTIYIVAYDKEYITGVLSEKNIKDASAFLEKIFNVELHLPKVDNELIWETLFADISSQSIKEADFASQLRRRLTYRDKDLILSILNEFRRARRFARLYILNIEYIMQHYKQEVKYLDLFWLELLQMYDKTVYDILADDYGRLLYQENDRLILRPGIWGKISAKDEKAYNDSPCWRQYTPELLNRLFDRYSKKTN